MMKEKDGDRIIINSNEIRINGDEINVCENRRLNNESNPYRRLENSKNDRTHINSGKIHINVLYDSH